MRNSVLLLSSSSCSMCRVSQERRNSTEGHWSPILNGRGGGPSENIPVATAYGVTENPRSFSSFGTENRSETARKSTTDRRQRAAVDSPDLRARLCNPHKCLFTFGWLRMIYSNERKPTNEQRTTATTTRRPSSDLRSPRADRSESRNRRSPRLPPPRGSLESASPKPNDARRATEEPTPTIDVLCTGKLRTESASFRICFLTRRFHSRAPRPYLDRDPPRFS